MPALTRPSARHQASYLEVWDELQAAGEDGQGWLNWGDDRTRDDLEDPVVFAEWLRWVEWAGKAPDDALPEGRVRSTTLVWAEGDDVLGRVNLRHTLTPLLLEVAGHIGYVVRPSARRQGHATRMLAATLPLAADLGIEQALITCDLDNVGSARVIEANGGVLEDERHGKKRYWVPTR